MTVFASLKKWARRWIANFRRQIRKWTEQERERKKKGERKMEWSPCMTLIKMAEGYIIPVEMSVVFSVEGKLLL